MCLQLYFEQTQPAQQTLLVCPCETVAEKFAYQQGEGWRMSVLFYSIFLNVITPYNHVCLHCGRNPSEVVLCIFNTAGTGLCILPNCILLSCAGCVYLCQSLSKTDRDTLHSEIMYCVLDNYNNNTSDSENLTFFVFA